MSGYPNPSSVPLRTALRPTAALPHSQILAIMSLRAQAFYLHSSTDRNFGVVPADLRGGPLLPEFLQRRSLLAHTRTADRDAQSPSAMSLDPFLISARARIHDGEAAQRLVHVSRLARCAGPDRLEDFMVERAPLFYRSPGHIANMLHAGYFRTAFREALLQLPTSTHFRDSHFGEILSAIFAEAAIGWHLLYSKLRLLTAENSNPHKIDLLFFDPSQSTPTFIFGEVKSSMKSEIPAHHNKSCYPSLFNSLRDYSNDDLVYDLDSCPRQHRHACS